MWPRTKKDHLTTSNGCPSHPEKYQALHRTIHSASFILNTVLPPYHETLHCNFNMPVVTTVWIVPVPHSAFLPYFPPHLLFVFAHLSPPQSCLVPDHHAEHCNLSVITPSHSFFLSILIIHSVIYCMSCLPSSSIPPLWNESSPKGLVW